MGGQLPIFGLPREVEAIVAEVLATATANAEVATGDAFVGAMADVARRLRATMGRFGYGEPGQPEINAALGEAWRVACGGGPRDDVVSRRWSERRRATRLATRDRLLVSSG